uniref:Acyl-CoA dehydrogenase/oxidase N-terminal domain-containing protein n=1 Tax=Timema douglasi TaxID=61478 RepID=A0A7R8VHX6_TIMDO|nr:unnamed protein product [Timema douglasi]
MEAERASCIVSIAEPGSWEMHLFLHVWSLRGGGGFDADSWPISASSVASVFDLIWMESSSHPVDPLVVVRGLLLMVDGAHRLLEWGSAGIPVPWRETSPAPTTSLYSPYSTDKLGSRTNTTDTPRNDLDHSHCNKLCLGKRVREMAGLSFSLYVGCPRSPPSPWLCVSTALCAGAVEDIIYEIRRNTCRGHQRDYDAFTSDQTQEGFPRPIKENNNFGQRLYRLVTCVDGRIPVVICVGVRPWTLFSKDKSAVTFEYVKNTLLSEDERHKKNVWASEDLHMSSGTEDMSPSSPNPSGDGTCASTVLSKPKNTSSSSSSKRVVGLSSSAWHIKKMGELGLMGINGSEEYGGAGPQVDFLHIKNNNYRAQGWYEPKVRTSLLTGVAEKGCGGTGTIMSVHNALYVNVIDKFGTKQQKEKFLPGYTDGTFIGCFALSEPVVLVQPQVLQLFHNLKDPETWHYLVIPRCGFGGNWLMSRWRRCVPTHEKGRRDCSGNMSRDRVLATRVALGGRIVLATQVALGGRIVPATRVAAGGRIESRQRESQR